MLGREEKEALFAMTPDLPADFTEWVMDQFDGWHTAFYSRLYGDIVLECAACGSVRRYTTKNSDSLLPLWNKEKPHQGMAYCCPDCGAMGQIMNRKNRKHPVLHDMDIWIGQNLGSGGYMLRFFRPTLLSWPDEENGYEELHTVERMRIYFPVGMGQKMYKLYWHGNPYSGLREGVWDTAYGFNSMGFYPNGPSRGYIYPGTYEEMKGTVMEYSCTEEALDLFSWITIAEWQQAYIRCRWLEAFLKMGLNGLAIARLNGNFPRCNPRAKNPYDYLKVYKNRLKDLSNAPSAEQLERLDIFQLERQMGLRIEPELLSVLLQAEVSASDLMEFLQHMTLKRLSNYLIRQKKQPFYHDMALHSVYIEYRDYLRMRKETGHELDEITLFPKNLRQAHAKMILDRDKAKADKRKTEVNEKFGGVKARFKSADKIYHYDRGKFLIRPAKDAAEIVEEGRILHHCVGGDEYLSSHARKNSIICFMRYKDFPETPFVTVEINPDCTIEQWYGLNDSKPDEKKIDRWLKTYMKSRDPKKVLRESKRKAE